MCAVLLVITGCNRASAPPPPITLDSPPPAIVSSSSPTPTVPAPASPPSAPPQPITDATAAIVWQSGGASFKSVWVELNGSTIAIKRERREPVVATRRGLFALRISRGPTATVQAEALGAGVSMLLSSASIESCYDREKEAEVRIAGVIGSLVFTEAHGFTQSCEAAHPMWHDTYRAHDLESGAELVLMPFPGLARLTSLAKGKFQRDFGDDGGGCLMNPSGVPDLHSATFAYDGRGVLRGHYLFTMDSNYMCGTGPGHYTSPEDLHDSALPDTVSFWKRAPEWLVPYLRRHPSVGVSPLPVELDPIAAASAFDNAPLPPKH